MKKILVILLSVLPLLAMAESKELRAIHPHELRVGWGDPLFERAAFRSTMHRDYTYLSPTASYTENARYRYTGHLMLEYQYRFNHWFGLGVQADGSAFLWDTNHYHGGDNTPYATEANYSYSVVLMPTVRFTYHHHFLWDIYTELGLGAIYNGGTELDSRGKNWGMGFAADIALLGVSVGSNHLFGTLEVGGLFGMQGLNTIYLLSSRIVTLSIGARF